MRWVRSSSRRTARRPQQALDVLSRARRLYPGHLKVLLAYAGAAQRLGKAGDAIGAYREFLKLAPQTHAERQRAETELQRLEGR